MTAGLRLLAAVGLTAGLLACGGDEEPAAEAQRAVDSSAVDSATARPGSRAGGAGAADSAAGPDDGRPLRKRLLRLVNGRAVGMVVHAGAGLEWVVLDSVRAGDSTEVYVESRARQVGLRAVAVGADGPVASGGVDLTATGAARWLIPPGPDSSSAADPP